MTMKRSLLLAAAAALFLAAGPVLAADDYSAPGSWERTAAALPQVLATLVGRGLMDVAP